MLLISLLDPHLYKLRPLIISRLSVLLDYNKAYAIDITALLDVLQNIQHYEVEIPDSERSIKGTPVQDFADGTSGPPSWVCILHVHKSFVLKNEVECRDS